MASQGAEGCAWSPLGLDLVELNRTDVRLALPVTLHLLPRRTRCSTRLPLGVWCRSRLGRSVRRCDCQRSQCSRQGVLGQPQMGVLERKNFHEEYLKMMIVCQLQDPSHACDYIWNVGRNMSHCSFMSATNELGRSVDFIIFHCFLPIEAWHGEAMANQLWTCQLVIAASIGPDDTSRSSRLVSEGGTRTSCCAGFKLGWHRIQIPQGWNGYIADKCGFCKRVWSW